MGDSLSRRAFDILPPYPKDEPRTYHHTGKAKKEKIKSIHNFLIFMFGLFFIGVLFGLMKTENFKTPTSVNLVPQSQNTDTNTNQFELFDNQGQSNLINQPVGVRLLNGAAKDTNVTTVKNLLLANGYAIEKQAVADNTYGQTTIYYKKGKLTLAQDASNILKPTFTPSLQESSGLSSGYDLLIIVGEK